MIRVQFSFCNHYILAIRLHWWYGGIIYPRNHFAVLMLQRSSCDNKVGVIWSLGYDHRTTILEKGSFRFYHSDMINAIWSLQYDRSNTINSIWWPQYDNPNMITTGSLQYDHCNMITHRCIMITTVWSLRYDCFIVITVGWSPGQDHWNDW